MISNKWYRNTLYKILSTGQILFKWKNRRAVKILAYHDITDVDLFERQIKYLKQNYNVISIQDLEEYVYNQKPLPLYPVLITFDDGDMSMFTYGFPIFKKYDIPAVIFIITGLINTDRPFWWKLVQEYYSRRGEPQGGRNKINNLKTVSNEERVSFVNKISAEMPDFKQQQLTSEHLQAMAENNIILANHSHTHPMFDKISDDDFIFEFNHAKDFYERERMVGYEWLAFPYGNSNMNKEDFLRERGIKLAFLFDHKINKRKIHPYRISRIRVNSHDSMPEFKVKLSGAHSLILRK